MQTIFKFTALILVATVMVKEAAAAQSCGDQFDSDGVQSCGCDTCGEADNGNGSCDNGNIGTHFPSYANSVHIQKFTFDCPCSGCLAGGKCPGCPYKCFCTGGTAAVESGRVTTCINGLTWVGEYKVGYSRANVAPHTDCTACDAGYTLNGQVCDAHTCTCTGGTAAIASDGTCETDAAEDCTACDTGYTLKGQSCTPVGNANNGKTSTDSADGIIITTAELKKDDTKIPVNNIAGVQKGDTVTITNKDRSKIDTSTVVDATASGARRATAGYLTVADKLTNDYAIGARIEITATPSTDTDRNNTSNGDHDHDGTVQSGLSGVAIATIVVSVIVFVVLVVVLFILHGKKGGNNKVTAVGV